MGRGRSYQELQREIGQLEAETSRLVDKQPQNAAARDKVMEIQGQIRALRRQADEVHAAEVAELREIAGNATRVSFSEGGEATEAFGAFLRNGEVRAALEAGDDSKGGYVVPEPLHAAYVEKVRKVDPIFRLATIIDLTSGGTDPQSTKIEIPRKSSHGAVTWGTEKATREETTSPGFGMVTLECFDVWGYYPATQTWLDCTPGGEQIVLDDLYGSIYEDSGTRWAVGDGVQKPTGLFTNTSGDGAFTIRLSSTNDAVDAAQFLAAYFDLPAAYRHSAVWMMAPATLAAACGLAHPNMTNTPLVQWVDGVPMILGKPVVECDNAPAVGAGAFPVAFGDIAEGYAIGFHRRPGILRNPYSPPHVWFYALARIGGVPRNPDAIVLMKSDNA